MDQLLEFIEIHKKVLIAGLLLFIVLFIALLLFISTKRTQPTHPPEAVTPSSPKQYQTEQNSSPVYIYFTSQISDSSISVYKSDTKDTYLITQLPSTLRSITPLENGDLLYVSGLGFLDRGEVIEKFSSASGKSDIVVSASDGFHIENYIISDDEQGIVFWEVEKNKSTEGITRVVYQSLVNREKRTILVDEQLSDQTKYPVLYLPLRNSVILDSYSVNRKGLHQGLFEVSLDGGQLREILAVDSYSQIPVLADGGSKLVFTAYNPAASIQLSPPAVSNGLFRAVIRNPNEMQMIDLGTLEITNLVGLSDGVLYANVISPDSGSRVFYQRARIENDQLKGQDTQSVDITTGVISDIIDRPDGQVIAKFGDKYIIGFGTGTLMNLGGTDASYSQIYNGVYLYDSNTTEYEKILSDDDINVIGVR